jgi:tRNA threonylcarbamoyladenosine modification (KEOPS) complex Cgi121 subunit
MEVEQVEIRCCVMGPSVDPREKRREVAESHPGLLVQVVRAEALRNMALAEMLALQTFRAAEGGTLLARSPEMDFLLRVAGTSQIQKAVKGSGAAPGRRNVMVVASSGRVPVQVSDWMEAFVPLPTLGLSVAELRRVETAALLNAERS